MPLRTEPKGDNTYLRLIWEGLLDGGGGGILGAPIPGRSILISAPQTGDNTEGEIDGVWHPAVGDSVFSANELDRNGIPVEAQSVLMITRLPDAILNLNTDEAWELKNIAAYARLDGENPSITGVGFRGFPVGGVYGKAWISRENALAMRAISRWQPAPGQSQPYSNHRVLAECYFYREPIPAPVFEPSLIVLGGTGGDIVDAGTGGGGTEEDLVAADPISMVFPANATESLWVTLPDTTTPFLGLFIPANTGASSLSFAIRDVGSSGDGFPLLNTSVSIPATGGYIGGDTLDSLISMSYLLGGRRQIKGVLDVGNATSRTFAWISSGKVAATTAPQTQAIAPIPMSFAANATESDWTDLPATDTKVLGLFIPANTGATSITFMAREAVDTGDGLPLLDTSIDIPASGGYIGESVLGAMVSTAYLLGGLHQIKGVLDVGDATVKEFFWISAGKTEAANEPSTITLSFPLGATESNWVALPEAATKIIGVKLPSGIIAENPTISFMIRNTGDTGAGSPLLNTSLIIPATGGYVGAEALRSLSGLFYLLGGQFEIQAILSVSLLQSFDVQLFTP